MNAFLLAYIYVRIFRLILRNVRLLFRKIMSVVTILLASRVQNTKTQKGIAGVQFEFFDFSGSSLERGRVVSPPGRLKYLPGRRYHHVVHVATPVRFLGDGNSREFDVQLRRGRT